MRDVLKLIPKKPAELHGHLYCPSCYVMSIRKDDKNRPKMCPVCMQSLDWARFDWEEKQK